MITLTIAETQERLDEVVDALVSGAEDVLIIEIDGKPAAQMIAAPEPS